MTSGYDSDYHDGDHLRRLLDQRAARADLHGRFPSLSEFSDSPSIYSHAYFSPRPGQRADLHASGSASFHHSTHVALPPEPRSPMSDRERLDIPGASSLDLDDDPRNSFMTAASLDEEVESDGTADAADEDTDVHRVSAYGPKMTVHSRAPWELEDDAVEEVEEPDSAGIRGAFKFTKRDAGKRPKGRDGRSAVDARPSFESIQSRGKQSFDTTSSQVSAGGALLALAQASMSSTSLALSPSPQTSLREKLSLPRFRSRTPSNAGNRLEPNDSRAYTRNMGGHLQSPARDLRVASPVDSEYDRPDSRAASVSEPASPRTPSHDQGYHPYANPDLVGSYGRQPSPGRRLEELHALTYSAPQSPAVGRSESTATITESSTVTTISTMSQSRSQSSVLTPGTSVSSLQPIPKFASAPRSLPRGRKPPGPIEVSSPANFTYARALDDSGAQEVTVYNQQHDFPSPSIMTPSWPQSPNPVPIKLISLEEAQAQARERSRSATATATTSNTVSAQPVKASEGGFTQSAMNWTRMRSTSSSGSAKGKSLTSASTVDLHSTPTLASSSSLAGTGGMPQKTVVRKKSGFMRLFNAKDKAPASPPPVPSISSDVVSSVHVVPSTPSLSSRPRKQSSHRVPVPSLTPSLVADSEGGSGSSFESRSDHDGMSRSSSSSPSAPSAPRERQLSARRNVPGLSIVTTSASPVSDASNHQDPSPVRNDSWTLPTPKTSSGDSIAKGVLSPSDDPRSPEFIALSLRRISTSFGEFTGQISEPDSEFPRPSLDTDLGTPTTLSSAISPRSPPLLYRMDEHMADAASFAVEDQSSVIRALQEQVLTARKAWQRQLWELEGQVRDLKAEVEELRASEGGKEYCAACGRGGQPSATNDGPRLDDLRKAGVKVGGVVNRPRARTGVCSRFASIGDE